MVVLRKGGEGLISEGKCGFWNCIKCYIFKNKFLLKKNRINKIKETDKRT